MIRCTKLSRYKIKKIIECFCIDIDATKTSKLLKINRNTINRFFNIFRLKIYENRTSLLKKFFGETEVDESYFGAKRARGIPTKRGRGTHKQPVFGIFEREGEVYTEIVSNCKKKTLQEIILGKIDPSAIVHSDKWRGYNGLVDVGYDRHFRVNHSKWFVNKKCHINGIESFWSFTKRRIAKFNGVKMNFHLHIKECEWRGDKNHLVLQENLIRILNENNHLK